MTAYPAYGSIFRIGTRQVETATIVGTITGSGNASVTLTATGLVTGSPITRNVAVLAGDTSDTVATKIAADLNGVSAITDELEVIANGSNLIITCLEVAANNATINLAYTNGTCTGLTPNATSTNTTAGVDYQDVSYIVEIGGPGLELAMIDVTTHDNAVIGWDEYE